MEKHPIAKAIENFDFNKLRGTTQIHEIPLPKKHVSLGLSADNENIIFNLFYDDQYIAIRTTASFKEPTNKQLWAELAREYSKL